MVRHKKQHCLGNWRTENEADGPGACDQREQGRRREVPPMAQIQEVVRAEHSSSEEQLVSCGLFRSYQNEGSWCLGVSKVCLGPGKSKEHNSFFFSFLMFAVEVP